MMARKDLIETEETKRKDRAALERLRTKHNAIRGFKCPLAILAINVIPMNLTSVAEGLRIRM